MDIRDYDVQSLWKMFGIVSQEPMLFDLSIRENILYSKPNASNRRVLNACEMANALDFI